MEGILFSNSFSVHLSHSGRPGYYRFGDALLKRLEDLYLKQELSGAPGEEGGPPSAPPVIDPDAAGLGEADTVVNDPPKSTTRITRRSA